LLTTGKLEFLEKLEAEVPPGLVEVLQVPDLGPKKAALFWKQAGVTNLAELEAAARLGKLRDLPGMGEKSEARILAGIEALRRRSDRIPLGKAWPFAQSLLVMLRAVPGVQAAEVAGSLRRMRTTVGDIDLLAASSDSAAVMQAFVGHPDVIRVESQGETKPASSSATTCAPSSGTPPERFGTACSTPPGSKDHNVRLRELALKRGLSLSDQAFLKPDGASCCVPVKRKCTPPLPAVDPARAARGSWRGASGAVRRSAALDRDQRHARRTALALHLERWTLTIRQMAEAALKRRLESPGHHRPFRQPGCCRRAFAG